MRAQSMTVSRIPQNSGGTPMSAGGNRLRCLGIPGAFLLGVCTAASVCALDSDDSRAKISAPTGGKAVIYVYRPAQKAGRDLKFWLSIDGRHIGDLPNGKFFRTEINPGDHELWVSGRTIENRFVPVRIAAVAGQSYFVRTAYSSRGELDVLAKDEQELVDCCALAEPAQVAPTFFD
jgi:hypothetical protein